LSEVRDKLSKITRALNAKATRQGIEEQVAFIASEHPDRLQVDRIPTGIPNVDEIIGGGWQRGGFSMLWGSPGAGKSCLAMETIAHNQRLAKERGGEFWVVYWHNEAGAFPYEAAITAGVDFETMVVLDTQRSGEAVLNVLTRYLWDSEKKQSLNAIDLVVIDSVASVEPEAEVESVEEKGLEGSTVGRHAALFSKYFRFIAGGGRLGRHTAFLLVNQVRQKIGGYGDPETATGGMAMEFYPKIALKVSKPLGKLIKEGSGDNTRVVGHTVVVRVTKNNTGVGNPHASTEYVVRYGQGVDMIGPLFDLAVEKGIVQETSTGRYQFPYSGSVPELKGIKLEGPVVKVHGGDNLKEWIRVDEVFQGWLKRMLTGVSSDQAEMRAPGSEVDTLEDEAGATLKRLPG
jgi:recombination protein RecA